ncbi:TPA: hypothetical protein ACOVI5_002020 [Klebsiella oxytoca]
MKNIKNLIKDVLIDTGSDIAELPPALYKINKIPTLEKNHYRNVTPMLIDRFDMFGSWIQATHGDWLSIEEMETIWNEELTVNSRLWCIKNNLMAARDHWDNDASSLFKENRLSLFSGSEFTFERIYLLWLDNEDEPELWVYDSNGESRFKNLETYLKAYLNDDISTCTKSWRAK